MNANTIINDDMTLEEKLAAIDAAQKEAMLKLLANQKQADSNGYQAPVDPSSLFMCEGCQ